LAGGADLDDNLVTLKELDLFISKKVKMLTGGKQTPTTVIPADVPDFPISVK
jgi:hypothetical protein